MSLEDYDIMINEYDTCQVLLNDNDENLVIGKCVIDPVGKSCLLLVKDCVVAVALVRCQKHVIKFSKVIFKSRLKNTTVALVRCQSTFY